MHMIERYLASKSGDLDGGEDAIVATDDFVAVIDGATSVDFPVDAEPGRLPGRRAARTLAAALEALPAACDASGCAEALTGALATNRLAGDGDDLSAVVAVFSRSRREVWRIGDVHVAVDGRARSITTAIDSVAATARASLLACLVEEGARESDLLATDPGRQMILPLRRRQHVFRNHAEPHPLAYGAVDGRPIPDRFVEVIAVHEGQAVVLASDGYPVVLPTLTESESYLRRELEIDPLRIGRHPTTKGVRPGNVSFDDRAYVRLIA